MFKLDYKKEYSDLYMPKKDLMEIDVPQMTFIAVNGQGLPKDAMFQKAIEILYAYSFTIKMNNKNILDYVVPPLEGLWGHDNMKFDYDNPDTWYWTLMIRQPEFVTEKVFNQAKEIIRKKKPNVNVDEAYLLEYEEGASLQVMYVGPYSKEGDTIQRMHSYLNDHNYKVSGKHHEIYLSDPRKVSPDKMKTVLRQPFKDKI